MTSIEPVKLPQYSGGYSNSKLIKTTDGIFYTGMTRDEAKMIGRDKCLLRSDFEKVDKNKDNVLTNDEIMFERERQAHLCKWDAILCGIFALDDARHLIKGRVDLWNVLFCALFTGFAIDALNRKKKIEAANTELKNQLLANA